MNKLVKNQDKSELQEQSQNKLRHRSEEDLLGAILVDEKQTQLSRVVFFALCGLMILAVLAYGAVDTWALGFFFAGISFVSILWLADGGVSGELRYSRNLLQFPICGLLLIGLIQLLPLRNAGISPDLLSIPVAHSFSLDQNATRFFLIQLFAHCLFFGLMLTYVSNQHRVRTLANILIVFGFGMAILAILQSLGGSNKIYWMRETYMAIPFGTFVNGHHFAAFLEMTLALALGLIYARSVDSEKRFLCIFAAIIMGIAILMSRSRGGMVSLFAIVAFLTVATFLAGGFKDSEREVIDDEFAEKVTVFERNLSIIGGGLALLILIFGGVFFLTQNNSLTRGVDTMQGNTDVSSGRLHFWQVASQIILNNPIFGVGFDAFGVAFTRYDTWNGALRVERAHNDYLQILADAGILGFICVSAFIVILFHKGIRNLGSTLDPRRRGIILGALAGCFGILIHSFFDFPLRTPANAMIFLSLAALATEQIKMPRIYQTRHH